jgi:biopolymer transport protein ExbB/TolQ
MLQLLENGLFALGQVLRFPIVVLLWACVAAALFMVGRCFMEFLARARERRGFDLASWLRQGPALGADERRLAALPVALRSLLAEVEMMRAASSLGDGGLEHLVLEREERARHGLTPSRALVKVGPSLGLIGTLVPMGSSLAAMATGNLADMAGQMVVAFTSTIVGLVTGTLAYVVTAVRQHWVAESVREDRYLAERIASELQARGTAPAVLAGVGR